MNAPFQHDWDQANQRYLSAAIACVGAALDRHAAHSGGAATAEIDGAVDRARDTLEEAARQLPAPAALDGLCQTFRLSPFERDIVLLCAGVELEAAFASRCAAAQGDPAHWRPTFGLALAVLPEAHWSALVPASPLRRWRLVEVGAGETLTRSPLRLDERVLHYLTGLDHLDENLLGFVDPVPDVPTKLVPSHREMAQRLAAAWGESSREPAVVQLSGNDAAGKRAIAAAASAALGIALHIMSRHVVPTTPHEVDSLIRLWEREAALRGGALFLDADDEASAEPARDGTVERFLERTGGFLILASRTRWTLRHRAALTIEVNRPSPVEQRDLWRESLGEPGSGLDGSIDRLTAHFDLGASAIEAAAREACHESASDELARHLWGACRAAARPRLSELAQRIEPVATWDDLVVPALQRQTLSDIAVHVRQRGKVYEEWGFAGKSARGLGISALFSGASGTGKTMAAEVLANELDLDLYRIDLSQVVSKYIGETEKNLRRVFDAAEEGGAILLFDEADALFGKRSEVRDSHDRYANIEVSYLLQLMESYRGLAILTTNMKDAVDSAFLRRIRWTVNFPFPDAAQRADIWRHVFPAATPTEGFDPAKLARLSVPGGNIRNIAMHAAFLAAEEGSAVGMQHLLRAARIEYAKLEKPLTDGEVRGWG